MKDIINLKLSVDHKLITDKKVIGRVGENDCTLFQIVVDESLNNYWFYLDFIKPDGTKYKTSKLDVIDNRVIYEIPNALLSQKGGLQVQAVLQNEEGEIWKSTIETFSINTSINATDEIENQDDFIAEAQRLLDEVEEGLTPTIGENENWFICGKDTGKTSRGDKGEKGDKGDAGSVKFIIANELPTENIDDSAIYMIPAGATSEGNTYEEYIYVNGVWESLGSASVNVDMADYVKNTDYASEEKTGVVKIKNSYGIQISPTYHTLQIVPANNPVIDNRTSGFKPITPLYLDYAVGTVKASETQSGTAKMWISENEDGEVGLNISTEV